MSKEYFFLDEYPLQNGKYSIRANFENFNLKYTTGSYNLIVARVMGLHYADYLRMARDELGADIIGKGHRYPVALYPKTKEVDQFLKLLNKRAEAINKFNEEIKDNLNSF